MYSKGRALCTSLHLKCQCITCTHNIVTHINYWIHVLSPGPVLKVCLASKAAPNKGVTWLQKFVSKL